VTTGGKRNVTCVKILSVTSEIFPLIKTGGLADVTGSLPKALEGYNCYTRTLVPGYPPLFAKLPDARQIYFFPDLFGAPASLLEARYEQLDLLILDAPALYNRPAVPISTRRATIIRTTGNGLPSCPMWRRPLPADCSRTGLRMSFIPMTGRRR
jgi:glycogen synthase